MKSSPYVFVIPLTVALIFVVAVFGYKNLTKSASSAPSVPVAEKPLPGVSGKAGIPKSGFSDMTIRPVSDIRKVLDETDIPVSDDINALDTAAKAL